MSKPAGRSHSRYSRDAVLLLGQLIRRARIERRMTVEDLAERVGISRGLAHRVETGNPNCAIGVVFEAAAIVGVRLFDADQADLTRQVSANAAAMTLLPQAIRSAAGPVKDDF